MAEDNWIETAKLQIAVGAVKFLFEQGREIVRDIWNRRKRGRESLPSSPETVQDEYGEPTVIISDSIRSTEDALSKKIKLSDWEDSEEEIEHLTRLLEIHRKNYYLAKEQYAMWMSTLVPPILVHNLNEAEEQVANTIGALQRALNRLYSRSTAQRDGEEIEDDELGVLDFVVEAQEAGREMNDVLDELISATNALGEDITVRTEQMTAVSGPGSHSQAHRIAQAISQDMHRYADSVRDKNLALDIVIQQLNEGVSGYLIWTQPTTAEEKASAQTLRTAIQVMWDSILEASEQIRSFRTSLNSIRGVSRDLNRASSRVRTVLGQLLNTLESLESFSAQAIDLIDSKLEDNLPS